MDTHQTIEDFLEATPTKALEDEIHELEAELKRLTAKIELRVQAIEWKRAGSGDETGGQTQHPRAAPEPTTGKLRGRAAIRNVVVSNPEVRTWTISDMLAAITERGWEANRHSVQVQLSRMARDGEFTKPADGKYVPANLKGSEQPSTLLSDLEGGESNS